MAIVEQPKLRYTYVHVDGCKAVTMIGRDLARQLQNEPEQCEWLYCSGCRSERPVEQFVWVGSNGHDSGERVCPPKS